MKNKNSFNNVDSEETASQKIMRINSNQKLNIDKFDINKANQTIIENSPHDLNKKAVFKLLKKFKL